MKKIFSLILIALMIAPVSILAGCSSDKNKASNVRNTVYYVTKATKKDVDVSKKYTDGNMKIIFYNDLFEVEIYNEENIANYGKYWGTFSTKDDVVSFTIDGASGYFNQYEVSAEKRVAVFKTLRYNDKKLYTELVDGGDIYSFVLEQK